MKLPTIIAGPCAMESQDLMLTVASKASEICEKYGFEYVFKSSFSKANRSSLNSYTGPGLDLGMEWLRRVRDEVGVLTTTDIHEPWHAEKVREAVDIIQVPALLSRQTDLVIAASSQGKVVNIKKGQFLSPWKLDSLYEKAASQNPPGIIVTERGSSFGYEDVVVDFRSLPMIRSTGASVGFDATHSIQTPGSNGKNSGGRPEFIHPLAMAATAVGVDYLFFETHPNPSIALSDGECMLDFSFFDSMLKDVKAICEARMSN
jgi:2-dehydro-3-deoxyphosphooctonate aldolase (KDO 8-P synthase)